MSNENVGRLAELNSELIAAAMEPDATAALRFLRGAGLTKMRAVVAYSQALGKPLREARRAARGALKLGVG